MNYINTRTNEYPVTESDIRAAYPNISFGLPFIPPEEYRVVFLSPQPSHNSVIEFVRELAPELTVKGHWEQRWEVVGLPAEITEANLQAKAKADAKLVADKIETLWSAANDYTSSFISGVAISILTVGVIRQLPKSLAVAAWSARVWAEYYERKAAVTTTSADNLDFTTFGPMPYSVPELQAEVGM